MATNTLSFDDVVAAVEQLGEDAGKGKDTQIKYLLKVFEGGYHGALNTDPNKHGIGINDATFLAEKYVRKQNGSIIFDAKAPNQRKTISCMNTAIKFGASPKYGNGEPIANVNQLMTVRQKLRTDPKQAKLLDDAANTFLKYARAQLKRDTLIDGEELKSFCFRKDAELATPEQIIERLTKQLDKLIDGSASSGTAQCGAPNVINARQSLRNELGNIAKAKNAAKTAGSAV